MHRYMHAYIRTHACFPQKGIRNSSMNTCTQRGRETMHMPNSRWNEMNEKAETKKTDGQWVIHPCFVCPLVHPLGWGFRHWLEFMTWTYIQVSQLHERHLPVVCVASEHPAHCKAAVIWACPIWPSLSVSLMDSPVLAFTGCLVGWVLSRRKQLRGLFSLIALHFHTLVC